LSDSLYDLNFDPANINIIYDDDYYTN